MASQVHTVYTNGSGLPFGSDFEGPLTNTSTAGIDFRGLITATTATTTSVVGPAVAAMVQLTVPVWPTAAVSVVLAGATGDTGQNTGYNWGFIELPVAGGNTIFVKAVTSTTAAAVTMGYKFG